MNDQRRTAIVIGASMGGLLAARVLSGHYEHVLLIERDGLPPVGRQRSGVPQGRHAHGLLARGRESIEELFPGLTDEVVAMGGVRGDVLEATRWYHEGHLHTQAASGHEALCVTRPTLEGHLRDRVRALPNVRIMAGCPVRGLTTTDDRRRVTGVRVPGLYGEETVLHTDLVVDATGRGSRTPRWLESLGYERPEEEAVQVDIGYATRTYRRRDDFGDDIAVVVTPCVPQGRGGVVLAAEGDRWVVTLFGYADDRPPSDPDGWVDFAGSLPRTDIAELIEHAEPLDDPVAFRYPASVRRRYERLRDFPAGYLAFGDALCSFNPIYGQGMTVAALEALALRDCLEADASPLHRAFFGRAARLIDVPWDIAVGTDLRFDHVVGRRTPKVRFVNRYLSRLHVAAQHDPVVAIAFIRVVNLIDRPEKLLTPRIASRVLLHGSRGRTPAPALEPAGLESQPAPVGATETA